MVESLEFLLKNELESGNIYKNIFETNPKPSFIFDRNGIICEVNSAYEKHVRINREDLIGKNARHFNSGLKGKNLLKDIWKAINSEGEWQGELTNRNLDNDTFEEIFTVVL